MICMYRVCDTRVVDRQLLNGWYHRHENCRLCSRMHSHESLIFSYFLDSYFLSYGEFKMREIKLRVQVLRPLASGTHGALPLVGGEWGVTAGKASHNASNVRGVTAGKMGRSCVLESENAMPCTWGMYTALNISTGPLALHTFQTAGPVRASTLYLSLALQDHRVKCRASRLKITVARSMTNFATFSCILCLKFRYVCIAWLLYIHFYVNCFLQLCLHYVWSVTNIDVGWGKMGASRFSWGPVTFQIYWPPGPVAPGA